MFTGPRLALSWLTVIPVRSPREIGRTEGGAAITATPFVGVLLGSAVALLMWGLSTVSIHGLLAGALAVAALALLTRGMHVDGLADTADGLGCYGPPERAREIMKSGGAGPFAIVTLFVVFAVQATGFGSLAESGAWASVILAVAVGRVAAVIACRRGFTPAPGSGFGALVAGTQPRWIVAAWSTVAVLASIPAVPDRWWQGPLVVAVALAAVEPMVRHCARRFGGLSGDVLGAVVEVTTALVVVGLLVGG